MNTINRGAGPQRNKGFETTHQAVILAAVQLIAEKGVDALSMAAISRSVSINRTTLYYHFANRESLIAAVKDWAAQQLAAGFNADLPRHERMEHIARFVLENSELIKLFIDDFLSPGDIRTRYPQWDALVSGIAGDVIDSGGEPIDPEIYSLMMLTSAFIAPRVFRNSVHPEMALEDVVARFTSEQTRILKRDGLLKTQRD